MKAIRAVQRTIDRFLFGSGTPEVCSAIRIAYALLLLVLVIVWCLDATVWFSDHGVLRASSAEEISQHAHWSLFFWLPQRDEYVYAGLGLLLVHGALMLCGCWSQIQAACIFVWLTSFHHRNPLICDGEDTVFRLFAFFMVFMPLDTCWAVWRKRVPANSDSSGSSNRASAWALRLMQFEVTAIYLSTAISKWQGQTWRDGTALFYVSRMDDVFGRLWLPDFLFETAWIVHLATWSVLAVETLLPLLLWLPPTRRMAIALAIALHLSIEYSMHLFLFEWIMIVGVMSFIRKRP
ncbi:MAG: HTTM domain-containing protein [Pirellulaceae bacterium]